jgi:amidase
MLTHEHVLTRSVRDTAGVLDAIAGPGVGDPYTAPPPRRSFLDEVGADPGRLRVGFRIAAPGASGPPDPGVDAAVAAAAAQLEALGHHVEPADLAALDDPAYGDAVAATFPTYIAREVDRWSDRLGRRIASDELEPWNAMLDELGRGVTGPAYLAGVEAAQGWARRVVAWWADGHDLLLTPTVTAPTPELGYLGPEVDGMELLGRMGRFTGFSMPFNVTGQPAVSLPLHQGGDGLPVGVQLVAAPGREDVLLRVAAQLEAAHPWSGRRPPLAAG